MPVAKGGLPRVNRRFVQKAFERFARRVGRAMPLSEVTLIEGELFFGRIRLSKCRNEIAIPPPAAALRFARLELFNRHANRLARAAAVADRLIDQLAASA